MFSYLLKISLNFGPLFLSVITKYFTKRSANTIGQVVNKPAVYPDYLNHFI